MKHLLTLLFIALSLNALAAECVASPRFGKTDKGLFGGPVGRGRMYFDIALPAMSPNLMIDVGMIMSRMPGVVAMAPRWFTMFSPTACPSVEYLAGPKIDTAVWITFRTYF